jgi:hypothetical protein
LEKYPSRQLAGGLSYRQHGSAGGQGFLRVRLPYPAKTWGLSKRVDGLQPQDRSALTCRRKRLDCLLTRSDADCADPCPSDEGNPVVPCDQLAGKPFTLPASPGATPP